MSSPTPTRPTRPAAPHIGANAPRAARWHVRLLGAVSASDGVQHIDRFPSRAVAALLARLALAPGRAHAREELVDLLWPGVALAVGRNRLRQALSTLKSLLEPRGVPGAAVLLADRLAVRVAPGALACDAVDFERLLRSGQHDAARAQYGGELMPGYYDEWIADERQRLAALHDRLADGAAAATPAAPTAAHAGPAPPPAPPAWPGAAPTPALPSYLTRLFGADIATARLRALVQSRRLVTLHGPGGSGKTRLGVEVAQALRAPPMWPAADAAGAPAPFDRIAFVPLVACGESPQVLEAIARALLLAAPGGVATLAQALAGQRVLLVLDNFEQLVGRAEAVVSELLEQLPGLHLLVTSRRVLGLDGEVLVGAEPLTLPPVDAPLAVAAANAAVALFVDRARAARADFHIGERNHAAIVALVRALHGMPLAIELAASRVRSFPPSEMLTLLAAQGGGHLAMLTRGGPRAGHDARHASMSQVIAWSWQLLDAPARRLLAALALFPVDAHAAAVAAVLALPQARAAAGLDDLVAHSLVRVSAGEGAARFGLLEPVREFVTADAEAAAAAPALRARLRGWLLAWAEGLGAAATPAAVAPELATVHQVLSSAAADGAPADALALALSLRRYWDTDGIPGRVLLALETALQAAPPGPLRGDAHELLAYLRFEAGFGAEARVHAQAAVAAAGDDPARRARALVRQAWVEIAAGRAGDRAGPQHAALQAQLQDALDLARTCNDREAQALALHQLGVMASHVHVGRQGADLVRAEALMAQSQALWLALGDRRRAYARLRNRAQCWAQLGRTEEAMACFRQCEEAAAQDGDWVGLIDTLISLSALLAQQRRWAEALDAILRCLALCWQRWHRHGLAYALWNPPRLLARLHRPEPAMRLMGFAVAFWQGSFGPLGADDQRYVRRVRGLVTAQLGAARAEALWQEGAAMDVAGAVALALRR